MCFIWSILLCSRIPGELNDRRTVLGELNWIFTAITDTIAWNTLPLGQSPICSILTTIHFNTYNQRKFV